MMSQQALLSSIALRVLVRLASQWLDADKPGTSDGSARMGVWTQTPTQVMLQRVSPYCAILRVVLEHTHALTLSRLQMQVLLRPLPNTNSNSDRSTQVMLQVPGGSSTAEGH